MPAYLNWEFYVPKKTIGNPLFAIETKTPAGIWVLFFSIKNITKIVSQAIEMIPTSRWFMWMKDSEGSMSMEQVEFNIALN